MWRWCISAHDAISPGFPGDPGNYDCCKGWAIGLALIRGGYGFNARNKLVLSRLTRNRIDLSFSLRDISRL